METGLTDEEMAKARDARLRLERDDYHNAISGLETGRMLRFGAKSKAQVEAKQRKADRVFQDALDRLLADPEYRILYEQLGDRLAEAERTADQALANIQTAIDTLDDQIAEMEVHAARGPDGLPVFRTADGRVVNAYGEELPAEIAEGIIWPPNAPSAEAYFSARDRRSYLRSQLEDWQGYRNETLGGLRHRYDDRDEPMSKDELKGALDALDAARPPAISMEASPTSQEAALSTTPMVFPKIGN